MRKRYNKKKVAGNRVSTKVTTASVGVQGSPSWFRSDWLWGLILILSVILAYTPLWKAGFIWDDNTILTANPCIVGPLGLKEIWTTSAADICPLTLTTFWVEHMMWGLNPLPYHLVNVLLHGLSAILLWRVLRALRVQGAWLGAALWAIHPVVVESVAWITEMKNTESGLFFLLSILFFLRWLRAKEIGGGAGGEWNYVLSLLSAALAMAAKSSTVTLPVVLCLCAWWVEGRWRWRTLVRMVPVFLMTIAASALSIWTQGLQLATVIDPQWVRTWPERLAAAGDAIWFYLGKLLWPHPLMTIYPRWQIDAGQWVSYLALLAAITILAVFWLKREAWSLRACFFAFAYFLAVLLPALGLIDNYIFRFSFVFDHFQYLASIGPLALVGAGLSRLSALIIPKKPVLQSILCAGLLMVLATASWQRSWAYESEEKLWTAALAKNPACWIGHNNLGNILLQKTLGINPDDERADSNFGAALFQKEQLDEPIAHFKKALELNPNYPEAHYNLGLALFQMGQVDDAVAQYQKALELKSNYPEAHYNLGLALFQMGTFDEAIAQFQKTLEIRPSHAKALINLGNALFQEGQPDEAIDQFQKALELNPNSFVIHYNLGNVLLQKGQLNEAINQFQKALELNPNSFAIHYNLGSALIQKGRMNEAITEFEDVLRLKPDFSPAQDALNKVQAFVRQREGNK